MRHFVFGLVLSAACLWLGLREVNLEEFRAVTRNLEWTRVAVAVLLVATAPLIRAYRWQILFRPHALGYLPLLEAILVGHMVNIVAPGRFGEVARLYLLGNSSGQPRAYIGGTVAIEKLLEVVGLVSFSLIVAPLLPLPTPLRASLLVLSITAFAVLFLGFLSARFKQQLLALFLSLLGLWESRITRWIHIQLSHVLNSLEVLRRGSDTLLALGWTFVTWVIGALVNWLALEALHVQLPWTAALVVLITLQVGVALPSAPGKIGVFQGLCVFALSLYGLATGLAFTYGILLYGIVFGPPLLSGIVALIVGQSVRRVGHLPPAASPPPE